MRWPGCVVAAGRCDLASKNRRHEKNADDICVRTDLLAHAVGHIEEHARTRSPHSDETM